MVLDAWYVCMCTFMQLLSLYIIMKLGRNMLDTQPLGLSTQITLVRVISDIVLGVEHASHTL